MNRDSIATIFFLFVVGGVIFLSYRILAPFLVPIAWAGILAILFYPLYDRLKTAIRSNWLRSLAVTGLIVVVIIGPLTYLLVQLVAQAGDLAERVNEMYRTGQLDRYLTLDFPWLTHLRSALESQFDLTTTNLKEVAREGITRLSGFVLNQVAWIIGNLAKAVLYFFVMLFTLFYVFLDGGRVIAVLKRLTPLREEQTEEIFRELREIIIATMYGGVVVALVQGFLGGMLFWIVGIPSPVLWGSVMAFLSIIPFVGAFVVYVPAALILMLDGSVASGLTVLLVGTLVISQIDNFLRPYLMARSTSLHPLILFFAVTGGIAIFGLLGIVVGPVVAATFLTLLKIIELRLAESRDTL